MLIPLELPRTKDTVRRLRHNEEARKTERVSLQSVQQAGWQIPRCHPMLQFKPWFHMVPDRSFKSSHSNVWRQKEELGSFQSLHEHTDLHRAIDCTERKLGRPAAAGQNLKESSPSENPGTSWVQYLLALGISRSSNVGLSSTVGKHHETEAQNILRCTAVF
jgi:hypothetical protein